MQKKEVLFMLDMTLLKKLCTTNGISGDEGKVRELIISEIQPYADSIRTDPLGNLLVFKKGKQPAQKKLLISAHMDEVGFIVTYITENGCLKFAPVGGINDSAAFARNVIVGEKEMAGVICSAPIHLVKGDERKKNPKIDTLLIDIGAKSREEAQQYVSLGDPVCFEPFFEYKDGRVISKAIDDRFGCLVLIEMLKSELPYDMYFSFVVQEEIGLRGARTAAYTIQPDLAIVVEATTASDIPSAHDEKRVCCLGSGAVVSFMDRSTMYDKHLYKTAMDCAKSLNIKAQTKTMIAGGNDAGIIHQSCAGVRTLAVSVPCRYIHSAHSLSLAEDMEAVYSVVRATAEKVLSE